MILISFILFISPVGKNKILSFMVSLKAHKHTKPRIF